MASDGVGKRMGKFRSLLSYYSLIFLLYSRTYGMNELDDVRYMDGTTGVLL